jgi:aspartate/methionine/tyrosine aminotransferase
MDDIYWISKLQTQAKKEGIEVFNISDWDSDKDEINLPLKILEKFSTINLLNYSKYYFFDSAYNLKQKVKKYILFELGLSVNESNIMFVQSSTYGLFLISKYLELNRVLLIKPIYFSIEKNLKEFGYSIFSYYLTVENNFLLEINKILNLIEKENIEVLFLTNPIFCVGENISQEVLRDFFYILKSKNIWIVIDNTFGNMDWHNSNKLLNDFFIQEFLKNDKIIYLDSPSKTFFLNGLKFSLIISSLNKNTQIEYDAEYTIGGVTLNQIELINQLFECENNNYLESILQKNLKLIYNNFLICNKIVNNGNYFIPKANSGVHILILHKIYKLVDIDIKYFMEDLLFNNAISILTIDYFSFHKNDNFGFRLNLSKNINFLTRSLNTIISMDMRKYVITRNIK